MCLLVKLFFEALLLLSKKVQTIVADLGQTNPIDSLTAGGKGVVGLLSLSCNAGPVFLYERFVDGFPVFFRGVLQFCEGCLGDCGVKNGSDMCA